MNLNNPFPPDVRVIYMYCWECFECGQNGTATGGLELHHIWGRVSWSPLNCAVLCGECHSHVGHSQEEHQRLFRKAVQFLLREEYKLTTYDNNFLLLISDDLRGFSM